MATLAGLVERDEINFYNQKRKLDANPGDFGEYNWNLIRYLANQSDKYLTVKGKGLESFLFGFDNVYELTHFLMAISAEKSEKREKIRFYVEADINKIDQHYSRGGEGCIANLPGTIVVKTADWLTHLPQFERMWNFALCDAVGSWQGPGYEWPMSEEEFEETIAEHAQTFLIGTKEQLQRYEHYMIKFPERSSRIKEALEGFRSGD